MIFSETRRRHAKSIIMVTNFINKDTAYKTLF